jgi:predicted PurR-regulated permease PerM
MVNTNQYQKRNSSLLNFAGFVIIIAGVMYAASFITSLMMAFFISIIFAEPIQWLKKKKVPQGLAITIVFILIIALFFGFGEIIAASFSSFSQDVPKYARNLNEMRDSLLQFMENRGMHVSTVEMKNLFNPSKVISFTSVVLGQLGGLMGNAFTIFFLALFLLLEIDSIKVKANAIMKENTGSLAYFNVIGASIRHYLTIKTLTSLLTGFLVWICLVIIGVDYAIIWALIAFLLNYIPNIGSIIAAVPAILFALIQLGFGGVIWTTATFVAVNMIIGNAVEPKMMGQGMGLSTFIVFLSLLFWGFILGTVGMFLSVPLTMAIKIMLEQNPNTRWIAIVLGTQSEAQDLIDVDKSGIDNS